MGKSVCVRAARMGNNRYIWGLPRPRSHAAPTIALPCARRFTNTSSHVVYSNQPAPRCRAPRRLVCPAALGTASLHLHLCCLAQMFSLGAGAAFGTPGCGARPLCSGMRCLADCPPPAALQLLMAAGRAGLLPLGQSLLCEAGVKSACLGASRLPHHPGGPDGCCSLRLVPVVRSPGSGASPPSPAVSGATFTERHWPHLQGDAGAG